VRALQQWSFTQVLLASLSWVLVILALAAVYIYAQVRGAGAETGSGGIGLIIPNLLLFILVIVGGPSVLLIAWLLARGRAM
jgi:hypothetical protein